MNASDMPTPLQFVVLHHTGIDEPHFDFLLESAPGSDLATWRMPVWPPTLDQATPAKRLRDHRRFYLTHTGEIPSPPGNPRGYVARIDQGHCAILPDQHALIIQLPTFRFRLEPDPSEQHEQLWWVIVVS
jgi:hypothetical protein